MNYNNLTFLELEKKTSLDADELEDELESLDEEGLIERVSVDKERDLNQFGITEKGERMYKKYMRNHFDTAEG
ncbi:MAG: hypothetical protein EF811_05815 [Methanonatronarchaeia archaeon]|nr:MAG: hypothetical protein EF811_05815 [Methanonatronarchaeia archaeon]